MGYYSEVTIRCEEKAFEMFKEAWKKAEMTPDKVLKTNDGTEDYIIQWQRVKWDTYYLDVAAINDVIKKLNELQDPSDTKDEGLGYKFMRVGENLGDIETEQNDWEIELYVIQCADIPDGDTIEV
jgi:hypothetical protein